MLEGLSQHLAHKILQGQICLFFLRAIMSIKALPADTRRLLGSTTLIASPASLVKELLDNAIDANANSISVLISPNTVDKIEVRDNGHGIDAADFDALGRRGHTSKVRRFEDLRTASASFLGFRGEGLASASTLGYVSITTRTTNEDVASMFRLMLGTGGIAPDTRKLVPAPVGTTVTVTCLFSLLPVRRKVAVQEAVKTTAAIKTLLCGYAMARPHLRLSFKVMKGLVPEWHYSPMAGSSGMRQAVVLLFGAEVARQCQEIVVSTDELLDRQSSQAQTPPSRPDSSAGNFVFDACLPRPNADVSKLKLGGFVSVDGRPVSVHREGIVEKLLDIFYSSFGTLFSEYGSPQARVRGTFIRLNIRCPPGTYDANVDSAKTDVLFTDENNLCDAFANLCAKLYVVTAQTRYHNSTKALPSTPLRTQPALPTWGTVRGREDVIQSQIPTPQNQRFESANSNSIQEHVRPLHPDNSSCRTVRQQNRSTGGQSSISQLGGMFTNSTMGSSTILHSRRPVQNSTIYSMDAPVRHTPGALSHDIQLSPIRKNRQRRRLPARGLPTSPLSNTRVRQRGRELQSQASDPIEAPALPGLVSNDGFRQTTINFGGRKNGQGPETLSPGVPEPNRATPRQSFISAHDLYRKKQAADASPQLTETEKDVYSTARPAQGCGATAGSAKTLRLTPPPSQTKSQSHPRPTYTMRVNGQQLRQSFAASVRRTKAWDEETDYLSPEMADLSLIESRLKAAVLDWLKRTKAVRKETGEGALQVEFYLRKSLKRKALLVRDIGQ